MTVCFDTLPNGYDRTMQDDQVTPRSGNWQVIFKSLMPDGREVDYCRETQPGSMSREAIVRWAERKVELHKLSGAVIERW